MQEESIHFSIVIPTRERCDTLKSTLKTCVQQNYEKLEIIVSDNCSQDQTYDVVKSFGDARIRYFNTEKRMSMSHNWEFALRYVTGDYVMFLGDDDALLPDALEKLNTILSQTKAKAINWAPVFYDWPSSPILQRKNKLRVPLGRGLTTRSSKEYLDRVLSYQTSYIELPILYGFFVRTDIVNEIKSRAGVFFRSRIPDVYSGIAIAFSIDTYLHSSRPYALYGTSGHSTGSSYFNSGVDKKPSELFDQEENIPFHPQLEFCPSFPVIVAESFLQVQEVLPQAKERNFEIMELIERAIRKTATPQSKGQEGKVLEAIEKIAQKNNVNVPLDVLVQRFKPSLLDATEPRMLFQKVFHSLTVNCAERGAYDVYEAASSCEEILEQHERGRWFLKERFQSNKALTKKIISYLYKKITHSGTENGR